MKWEDRDRAQDPKPNGSLCAECSEHYRDVDPDQDCPYAEVGDDGELEDHPLMAISMTIYREHSVDRDVDLELEVPPSSELRALVPGDTFLATVTKVRRFHTEELT